MDTEYKVNLIRESMPSYDDYCKLIKVIWDNQWMTNSGPLHNQLEEELSKYLGTKHCFLYTNGHMALEAAIQAFKLKGEIITTPFTFISSTSAIIRSGLVPKFVDIDSTRLTIDPKAIEKSITDNTSAILGVHVYGIPCDVDAISDIAERYGLKVIYDAAHAFGVKYNGKSIGSYGDASIFSMHATKVFNTAEGGAITFSDDAYESNLKNIRNFGFCSKTDADLIGFNAKMSEFHAGVGLCNLKTIDQCIQNRRAVCERYRKNFEKCDSIRMLTIPHGTVYNYPYFPILLTEHSKITRDELFSSLDARGIQTRKYFYPLTYDFTGIKEVVGTIKCPNAEKISKKILCLPLYSDLKEEQVDLVINSILDCV